MEEKEKEINGELLKTCFYNSTIDLLIEYVCG